MLNDISSSLTYLHINKIFLLNLSISYMNNVTEKYALDHKRKFTTQEFSRSNLDDIISLNIQYTIYNLNNTNQYDFNFGNTIWNIDFDLFNIPGQWENSFAELIYDRIVKSIDTLKNIDVKANISEVSSSFKYNKYPVIKYYLDIHIKGHNTSTDDKYYFHTCLFLSPM